MTIHPAQVHALVRDRVQELQRDADRHRLPAETRTRVSLWGRLRRSLRTDRHPVGQSEGTQAPLLALEERLCGPSIIARAECHFAGESRFDVACRTTKQTGRHPME